jgi:hypothetical protein
MLPLTVATEDELSEAIALRLLKDFPGILIGSSIRRGGNGYLRSRIRNFCDIARTSPVLLLTDLDTHPCPPGLIQDWVRRHPVPRTMLLRVAVREVESWLLADHEAVVKLIGKAAIRRLPDQPDTLLHPKDFLLDLVRYAPRNVRLDLRAEAGAIARQGLGYNARLSNLVREEWQPARAAVRSPSLHRTMGRLRELVDADPSKLLR